jgi:hypothetical protein
MNYSIYSADRTTHLKIVVVALVTGISIAASTHTEGVVKADKHLAMTSSDALITR